MTEFELSVDSLMQELLKEKGSGLLTHRALELMPEVERYLQAIKRLEKELARHIENARADGLSPPPPDFGLNQKGNENS